MRVGKHDRKPGGDGLLAGPAPGVKVVGRLGPSLLDGVHRGHRKPGPVHQRTDGTAQPNIGEPLFGGGALQRIALLPIPEGRDIGMPFQRAVVKVHLGVQRHKSAPFAQGQRVDLKLGHILFGGKGRQPPHQRGQFPRRAGLQPPALQQVPGLKRPQVVASVQPGRKDPLRRGGRHSLDVHAAARRSHDGQALGCPVKSYRQIALPRARRALLDPHGIDALAVRPGLGRHQPCAEQGRGGLTCLFRAAAHLHAASLAPAPGMDLRFDHPHRAGQIPCGLFRFSGRGGKPSLRRGYPVCA